jgi:hypothetical protein
LENTKSSIRIGQRNNKKINQIEHLAGLLQIKIRGG